jgi:hypothetical protein
MLSEIKDSKNLFTYDLYYDYNNNVGWHGFYAILTWLGGLWPSHTKPPLKIRRFRKNGEINSYAIKESTSLSGLKYKTITSRGQVFQPDGFWSFSWPHLNAPNI